MFYLDTRQSYYAKLKDESYINLRLRVMTRRFLCSVKKICDSGSIIRLYDPCSCTEVVNGIYKTTATRYVHPFELMIEGLPVKAFPRPADAINFICGATWYIPLRDAMLGNSYGVASQVYTDVEMLNSYACNNVAHIIHGKLTGNNAYLYASDSKSYTEKIKLVEEEWRPIMGKIKDVWRRTTF